MPIYLRPSGVSISYHFHCLLLYCRYLWTASCHLGCDSWLHRSDHCMWKIFFALLNTSFRAVKLTSLKLRKPSVFRLVCFHVLTNSPAHLQLSATVFLWTRLTTAPLCENPVWDGNPRRSNHGPGHFLLHRPKINAITVQTWRETKQEVGRMIYLYHSPIYLYINNINTFICINNKSLARRLNRDGYKLFGKNSGP